MRRFYFLPVVLLLGSASALQAQETKLAPRAEWRGLTVAELTAKGGGADCNSPCLTKAVPDRRQTIDAFFDCAFTPENYFTLPSEKQNAPARISLVGEEFYGYLAYSHSSYADKNSQNGLTKLRTDGTKTWLWRDMLYTWQRCGFYHDGYVWLFRGVNPNGNFTGAYVTTCKLEDGSFGTVKDVPIGGTSAPGSWTSQLGFFMTMAFDPTTETAYGYSLAGSGDRTVFASWSMADKKTVTEIRDVTDNREFCPAMTFYDGQIWGITLDGELVKIATDGVQTPVFTPAIDGWHPEYAAAMAWSPVRKAFVLNALCNESGNDAKLYALDPVAKSASKIVDLTDGEEYYMFFSSERPLAAEAPAAIEDMAFSTAGTPELAGNITFTVPANYTDGNAIPASKKVEMTVYLDNSVVKEGGLTPGEKVTVAYDLANGVHFVRAVYAVDGYDNETQVKFFTGYDVPLAPASCSLATDGTITWKKSTGGVNSALGAYYADEDVTYDLYIDDTRVVSGLKPDAEAPSNTFKAELDGTYAATHVAKAVAVNHGVESDARTSSSVLSGEVLTVPFTLNPLSTWTSLFTVVNGGNGSVNNWTWNSTYGAYIYPYNMQKGADTWLFLPAVEIDDNGELYEFSFNAWVNDTYPEKFEVLYGYERSIAGMTETLIEPTVISDKGADRLFSARFVPKEKGLCYIGVHCISDADKYWLLVNNFSMSKTGVKVNSPMAPTDVTATAGSEGALNATVTFTLPVKTLIGADIPSDAILTGVVTSEAETVTVSGKPGETVSATVKTVQGENTLSVRADYGEGHGLETEVSVYTGIDLPGMPAKIWNTPSQDDMGTILSWLPPTQGENGGYINPATITYEVYQLNDSKQWNLLGSAGKNTSVSLTASKLQDLQILTLGARACNEAGKANYIGYDMVVLGPAMAMPVEENINPAGLVFDKFIVHSGGFASLYIDTPTKVAAKYANEKNSAFIMLASEPDVISFNLPKVKTAGVSAPAAVIDFYLEADMPKTVVKARAFGIEERVIAEISLGSKSEGWNEVTVLLPEDFKDKEWVELLVEAELDKAGVPVMFDSYILHNHVADDLGITALDGPTSPVVGKPATFTATITNKGFGNRTSRPEIRWSVTTTEGVAQYVTAASEEALAAGESFSASITIEPTADLLGAFEVKAELPEDGEPANNTASLKGEVGVGSAVVVTDLSARLEGKDVSLEWTAPATEFLESFENDTPMVANPAKAGVFKAIDRDGKKVYNFSGWDFPGTDVPTSFTVCNADHIAQFTSSMAQAYDGKQYLLARCPSDASQADDWLVSPEIEGVASVGFAVRALTYAYGAETVEVLASSTTDDLAAFTAVTTVSVSGPSSEGPQWKTFEVALPAGSKYFALHYNAKDIFGIQLDAITWKGDKELTGYAVVRNGELLAETEATAYLDTTAEGNNAYTYNVKARFNDGSYGIESNTAKVSVPTAISDLSGGRRITAGKGFITITGFAGEEVTVCNAAGVALFDKAECAGSEEVAAAAGVYVVRAAGKTFKVVVE